jgi:hypothetical protein
MLQPDVLAQAFSGGGKISKPKTGASPSILPANSLSSGRHKGKMRESTVQKDMPHTLAKTGRARDKLSAAPILIK